MCKSGQLDYVVLLMARCACYRKQKKRFAHLKALREFNLAVCTLTWELLLIKQEKLLSSAKSLFQCVWNFVQVNLELTRLSNCNIGVKVIIRAVIISYKFNPLDLDLRLLEKIEKNNVNKFYKSGWYPECATWWLCFNRNDENAKWCYDIISLLYNINYNNPVYT